MNTMLIGIDFYPYQTPSDKNFWLFVEIIPIMKFLHQGWVVILESV